MPRMLSQLISNSLQRKNSIKQNGGITKGKCGTETKLGQISESTVSYPNRLGAANSP